MFSQALALSSDPRKPMIKACFHESELLRDENGKPLPMENQTGIPVGFTASSGHSREQTLGKVTHKDLNMPFEPEPRKLCYLVQRSKNIDSIQKHGIFSTADFGGTRDRSKILFSFSDPSTRCVEYGDGYKYICPYQGHEFGLVQKNHNEKNLRLASNFGGG